MHQNKPKTTGSRSVADLVTDAGSGLGGLLRRARALDRLNQLLIQAAGPEFEGQVSAVSCKEGRLVIVAPNAAVATVLKQRGVAISKKLTESSGQSVKNIQVRIDPGFRPAGPQR